MNYIMSTPVIPPNFVGTISAHFSGPGAIVNAIKTWRSYDRPIKSFCGHQATAAFLGVEMHRGELSGADLQIGDVLVGIRPLRRPTPGEELEIIPANFQGFILEIVESTHDQAHL